MQRASMDRFIDTIEWIAAGFVGIVALDVFVSVLLRNTLNYAIPDSFDIGRMLLGILIFWGIAATSYRGTHITVDLVWANVSPRYQRWKPPSEREPTGAAIANHDTDAVLRRGVPLPFRTNRDPYDAMFVARPEQERHQQRQAT